MYESEDRALAAACLDREGHQERLSGDGVLFGQEHRDRRNQEDVLRVELQLRRADVYGAGAR